MKCNEASRLMDVRVTSWYVLHGYIEWIWTSYVLATVRIFTENFPWRLKSMKKHSNCQIDDPYSASSSLIGRQDFLQAWKAVKIFALTPVLGSVA